MKQKRNLLIGIILGICITGALWFLYLPLMTDKPSFLLGFLACLAFVSLALTSFFIRKRQSKTGNGTNKNFIPFALILAGLLIVFLLFKLSEWFTIQAKYHQTQIAQKAELIESTRLSGLVNLMSNVMDKIDDELQNNPKRILSDETIARIAALSYSFESHLHINGDTSSAPKLSPERGQLLLMISKMNLDSGSLKKIMGQASFSGAVLRDADLRNANLRGADLEEADLQGAKLQDADIRDANLRSANLWGSNLNKADLTGADLTRADLRWTELNDAELQGTDLYGANISSAQMRRADLSGADLQWADLNGTFMNESIIAGANLFRASLKRAQLVKSDLSNAKLTLAILTEATIAEANLTGADLTGVFVAEKNWPELLSKWDVTGATEIQSRYKIADEISKNPSQYHLEKIKD